MKKVFAVLAFAFVGALFTSCKKDYTCTCTVTAGGSSTSGTTTIHDTKSNADSKCKDLQGSSQYSGMTVTCKI